MFPASSAKIGRCLCLGLLAFAVLAPGCLAVDPADRGLVGNLAEHAGTDAAAAPHEIRDRLRSTLRPIFELSLLLLCGLGAAAFVALRCRRTEKARLSNLRQLRLVGGSEESEFPARLIAELRGVLARIGGRSDLLLDRLGRAGHAEQVEAISAGLWTDATSLREILYACERLEICGPKLRIGRQIAVDLGALLSRLSGVACGPGPIAASDPELLELALRGLLRLSRATREARGDDREGDARDPTRALKNEKNSPPAVAMHRVPGSRASFAKSAADSEGAGETHGAEHALIVIHSPFNHTLSDQDAGLEVSRRILIGLGAKLRMSTEHSQGCVFEVELPL